MLEPLAFQNLLERVRRRDQAAAETLFRVFNPDVERAIAPMITGRLARFIDDKDICQSVFSNFFIRAAVGQFELTEPIQLRKLLVTMARNRVLDESRRQQAERRDSRRVEESAGFDLFESVRGNDPTPSTVVSGRELESAISRILTDEERYVAEQRTLGREWADIAAELGSSPDAVRKKMARAMDRVVRELQLD